MFKSLLNKLNFRRPTLSETDFNFAKKAGLSADAINAIEDQGLKGYALNIKLCRSALTGSELPANWWEGEDAQAIHTQIAARIPALGYLSPSFYGPKVQEGQRGFVMAAQEIGMRTTFRNINALSRCSSVTSYMIESKSFEG